MTVVMVIISRSSGVRCAVQKPLFACDVGEVTQISILTGTMNGFDRMETDHRAIFDMLQELHTPRRNAQANDRKDTRILRGLFQPSHGVGRRRRRIIFGHFDRCRTEIVHPVDTWLFAE